MRLATSLFLLCSGVLRGSADNVPGWTRQLIATDVYIQFDDDSEMPHWAVGLDRNDGSSVLLRRFSGLGPFQRVAPSSWSGNTIAEMHIADQGTVFVALEDTNFMVHYIIRSVDNGQSWSKVSPEFSPSSGFIATDIARVNNTVVVSDFRTEPTSGTDPQPVLVQSNNGGQTFVLQEPNGMDGAIPLAISMLNDTTAVIVGRTDTVGEIWKSSGNLTQWTSIAMSDDGALVDINQNGDTILVFGINCIVTSIDGGDSWHPISLPEGGPGARYASVVSYLDGVATLAKTTDSTWTVFEEKVGQWRELRTFRTASSLALLQKTPQGSLAATVGGGRHVLDPPTSIIDDAKRVHGRALVVKRGDGISINTGGERNWSLHDTAGRTVMVGSAMASITAPPHVSCGVYYLMMEQSGRKMTMCIQE